MGCQQPKEIVEEVFQPRTDHEAYLHSLTNAGITKTALGRDWEAAAYASLRSPLSVETPFAEEFYIDPAQVSGTGYRINAQRGHKIEVSLTVQSDDSLRIFLDVFRIINDSLGIYTQVASASPESNFVEFEPLEDAEYIIRLQNELLRGGRFEIKILKVPSLAFPVSGRTNSAIGSLFGAPRDGGKRKHHGIDIFARRHTPIIAPTDGYVRSTKDNVLGGKVIWFRDRHRPQTLYFAHLQDVLVEEDMEISQGDTIGTVGNSGNAITTPPHLHFGIYSNGPVDPYPFVAETRTKYKKQFAKSEYIGVTARAKKAGNVKLFGQLRDSKSVAIEKDEIFTVVGASGVYYRVILPDESQGYLFYDNIEMLDRPIRRLTESNIVLRPRPEIMAPPVTEINSESSLSLLGYSGNFWFVETLGGARGWLKAS